ncbi:MAG: flippase-like domain-containing protein [Candidatus Aminicenantes bacterium]|nr:MAG: flippase-like domain-containing protein [Candidatus Aminicenantes bacterium]
MTESNSAKDKKTPYKLASDGRGSLTASVGWGYTLAFLLMLFIFLILLPEAEGPSPWDAVAFQKGLLEIFANFRILDELADLSIVKVADVGEGLLKVDLDLVSVSNRKFGWAPFSIAILFVAIAIFLRGIRQRFLSSHFGIPPSMKGQISTYFFGRGINLFFPFGPGDLGTAQAMKENGASDKAATSVVYYTRVFEVVGISTVLLMGFIYLGWEGAVEPFLWTVLIFAAVVTLTRPLGPSSYKIKRYNILARIWDAFNGRALFQAIREMRRKPRLLIGLSLLSAITLIIEIAGYWSIKQAFSSPMDDYVLMKDMIFIHFGIVIAVANIARIIPYTFASFGIYEIISVFMFRIFGEGYLSATTVTLLDSFLINGLTLVFFLFPLFLAKCPSILETWRNFFSQSAIRYNGEIPQTANPGDERISNEKNE